MVLITDKQYYMDDSLKGLLDECIKSEKTGWDNLIIIDGKERVGKSTFAQQIAYYIANVSNKTFGVDQIFFDPEELLLFATSHEKQIIIWDEACLGGLRSQWRHNIQQTITSTMMLTGTFNHFYIMIIPSFFKLNDYLALTRSAALFNVHGHKGTFRTRGEFTCYNEMQKTWIYNNYRKSMTYGKIFSFRGRITLKNTENLVDNVKYQQKKIEAIKKYISLSTNEKDDKLSKLQMRLATNPQFSAEEVAKIADVHINTVYFWRKKAENASKRGFSPNLQNKETLSLGKEGDADEDFTY